jgi:hypothetical protein
MSRHDSQERMDVGSLSAAPPSASLDSSPSGTVLRSSKRRRVSRDGSCSTSTGPVVTAILGADIFKGTSNTAYRNWLQEVQPTAAKHDFASFVGKKVADHADGVWTTGMVQCLHQGVLPSMTRTLPTDTLLPNKSQPFSIVWADNTPRSMDFFLFPLSPRIERAKHERTRTGNIHNSHTTIYVPSYALKLLHVSS